MTQNPGGQGLHAPGEPGLCAPSLLSAMHAPRHPAGSAPTGPPDPMHTPSWRGLGSLPHRRAPGVEVRCPGSEVHWALPSTGSGRVGGALPSPDPSSPGSELAPGWLPWSRRQGGEAHLSKVNHLDEMSSQPGDLGVVQGHGCLGLTCQGRAPGRWGSCLRGGRLEEPEALAWGAEGQDLQQSRKRWPSVP